MDLLCNAFRITYLLSMPECKAQLMLQLHSLCHQLHHNRSSSEHKELAGLVISCASPAEALQKRFESLTSRVVQVGAGGGCGLWWPLSAWRVAPVTAPSTS
jgi:hypothetical protein